MHTYVEEMLESDHAVWWSPDGGRLLYVEFSDISVPTFSFPLYGPEQQLYPEIENIAYPKVCVLDIRIQVICIVLMVILHVTWIQSAALIKP